MKKPVVLRIYKGDQLLGVKQFLEPQIVIGRPGEVQVALEGESVSVIHAAIEERDSVYFVCDLGSESGTLKNGTTVLDSSLESGDILQIGEYRLEFYIGVPRPKAPPPGVGVAAGVSSSAAPTPVPESAPEPEPPPEKLTITPAVTPTSKSAEPLIPFETVKVPEKSAAEKQNSRNKEAPLSPSAAAVSGAASVIASSGIPDRPATPSFSLSSPKARAARHAEKTKEKKRRKTFAPPSPHTSVKDFIKPSKGTVVEVLVAWRERVISTHHFSNGGTITMGSKPNCDVVLPLLASKARKVPLLRIDSQAKVFVSPEMTGELVRGQTSSSFVELLRQNRMVKTGAAYAVVLEQGEMIRLELSEQISVVVRYVSDSPKPIVAPLLDLTTSEFTGVVLAAVLVSILSLYMFLYQPPKVLPLEEDMEPLRTALIIVAPTPPPLPAVEPPPPQVKVEATPIPQPTPPPVVVKATPSPRKIEEPKKPAQTKAVTNLTTKNDPGKSANAAPNKNKTGPRTLTSPKQGGSIKTTDKEGSQIQSKKRDVSKSGVFSVFGGGGANNELAQSTTGAGELAGLANAATGKSGYGENRAGEGLGSATKDTGVGGSGKALTGIAGGVGTQGRGSGNSGYGTGGLGNKAGVKIVTGGNEESFSGTIDREAIRRVILANQRTIKTCYERQLNRNPELFGKLVLKWEIGEQGRVLSVGVKENELGNKEVANCILDRLKTWKFPEPPSGQVVEVAYPFFFSN